MTGVGTLLAALVALGAFFVGQRFLGGGENQPPEEEPLRNSQGSVIPPLDEKVQFGPEKLLLTSQIDFDATPLPNRNPEFGETDTYMWNDETMSSSYGMVKWDSSGKPTQNGCARKPATHGTSGKFTFEAGDRFCIRTDMGRVALIVVQGRTANGWEMEATVWKQRLS